MNKAIKAAQADLCDRLDAYQSRFLDILSDILNKDSVDRINPDLIESVWKEKIRPTLAMIIDDFSVRSGSPGETSANPTSIMSLEGNLDNAHAGYTGLFHLISEYKEHLQIAAIIEKIRMNSFNYSTLSELLQFYLDNYVKFDSDFRSRMEEELSSLENFSIRFIHVHVNSPRELAKGFNQIRKDFLRDKLSQSELELVMKMDFSDCTAEGLILFELSPQVIINNEVFFQGRVIAS